MARDYRARALTGIATILLLTVMVSGSRAEPPATVLGCGVTGRIHVLRDDLVLESNHVLETVRNYADWRAPAWIGWNLHQDSFWWSEILSDGNLVVALNPDGAYAPAGFAVYDFTDPAAAVELSVVNSPQLVTGWLRGSAFYAGVDGALIVYDLSAPATPTFSGAVLTGSMTGSRQFSAVGATLYLIDQADDEATTLRAVDVTDPPHPVDRGPCLTVAGRVDALAGGDGVLYGIVSSPGPGGTRSLDLVIWGSAAAGAPAEAGRVNLCAGADAAGRALRRDGALLLAAGSDGNLRAFDVATPAAPVAGWTLAHDVRHLALGAHAMFVETADGLYTYGRTDANLAPDAPEFRAPLPRLSRVAGDGPVQIAQVLGDETHLWPLDVSNPQLPRIEKPIETGLQGRLQYADGVGVMRGNDGSERLLDLTDPRQPRLGAVLPPWGPSPSALLLSGAVAAVVDTDPESPGAFHLYDVSDPDAPVLRSTVEDRGLRYGDRRWLVCGLGLGGADRLRLWKLDGELQATRSGFLRSQIGIVVPVCIVDGCAYLFGQDRDDVPLFEVHDITGVPRLVRTIRPGMIVWHVVQRGDKLVVAGNSGCLVYDVSTPEDPREVARFYVGGEPVGLACNGDVATIWGNLVTVRTSPDAAAAVPPVTTVAPARLLPAQPNPFNPRTTITFAIDRAHDLTLGVYDVRGCLVRDLAAGRFEAGTHTADWDGRATGGAPQASGTYFVRLHGPGVEAVQSVTLVK